MRPFLYPLLVAISLVGLYIVGSGFATSEQQAVCTVCGRLQTSHNVTAFGGSIESISETVDTAFTQRVPWAAECKVHLWSVIVNRQGNGMFLHRSSEVGEQSILRRILDDPTPVLRLADIAPQRAREVLKGLVFLGPMQTYSRVQMARWAQRRNTPEALPQLLEQLWKKPMSKAELERGVLEDSDTDAQGPH